VGDEAGLRAGWDASIGVGLRWCCAEGWERVAMRRIVCVVGLMFHMYSRNWFDHDVHAKLFRGLLTDSL
jgi:hypothetical protein